MPTLYTSAATLAPRAVAALWGRDEIEDRVEIETARRVAAFERAQSVARQLITALAACEWLPGGYEAEDIAATLQDVLNADSGRVWDHVEASVREDLI
jgi:hypothetical protein